MLDFISSRFRTLAVLCIALALALGPGGGHRILIRGVLHWMGEPKVLDPPEDVAVLRDIEFSREGPLTLDLFTPQSRSAAPLPVVHCPHTAPDTHVSSVRWQVVFLFGGSWFAGNKHQVQLMDVPALLCRRGYAVISPDYRLSVSTMVPERLSN